MATYYFDALCVDDDEIRAYPIKRHLQEVRDDEVSERILYPAVPMRGTGDFYCTELGFHGKRGEDFEPCGRLCSDYEPRNGKSGRCRHSSHVYDYDMASPVLLKSDGSLTPIGKKEAEAWLSNQRTKARAHDNS